MMLDDGQHTVPMLTMGTRDLAIFRNRIAKISNQITNCVYVMIVDFHAPGKKGRIKLERKDIYTQEKMYLIVITPIILLFTTATRIGRLNLP